MSLGSTLLNIGWDAVLGHHGLEVLHVPASGRPTQKLTVLDNGQPEAVAALAMNVDGLSRMISVTRSQASVAPGDGIVIGTTSYKVLQVRYRNDQATDLMLGNTVISGKQ